jgi:type VI secretion system secreted protein Hcp
MRIGRAGRRLIVLCGAVSALLPAVPAAAAFNAYMIVTGTKQGAIKAEASPAGAPAGAIQLSGVVREAPIATGMAAGKRQHSPITITKEVDAASPKLFQASDSHEVLSQVVIGFQGGGAADTAQKIVLTNATILSIRKAGKTEQITLDYQAIDVTYAKGGKTATDDWSVPK